MACQNRLVDDHVDPSHPPVPFQERVAATLHAHHDMLAELLAHQPKELVAGLVEMLIAEADRQEAGTSMRYAAFYRTELDMLASHSADYRAAYGL